MRRRRTTLGAALAVAILAGCNRAPVLVPVTGLVKIDGKPARAVMVYFWPGDDAPENFPTRHAIGISDAQGRFKLQCSAGGVDGIEAGTYRVTFSKPVARSGKEMTSPNVKPDELGAVESLPPKYTDKDKTDQTATVSKESTDFVFELSSK